MEQSDFSIFEKELKQYEEALVDPHVTKVFDVAAQYNEILAGSDDIDNEQLFEIEKELDARWGMIDRNVLVTGSVQLVMPDNSFYEAEVIVDELPLVSKGFARIRTNEKGIRFGLVFVPEKGGLHIKDPMNEDQILEPAAVAADIADVFLDFPYVMSRDRAEAWLAEFMPDVLESIQCTMFNAPDDTDPIATLPELADIGVPHDTDSRRRLDAQIAIATYIDAAYDYDEELPYVVTLSGAGGAIDMNGQIRDCIFSGNEALASVGSVYPEYPDGDEGGDGVLHVVLNVYHHNAAKVATSVIVPLSSLRQISSLRYDFNHQSPES